MAFTQNDLDALLSMPENLYLKNPAKEKHEDFKQVDPFPDIQDALLNSADIVKYILTTGMIDPFTPEKLSGATYTCEFSGEYIYWDAHKIKHKKNLPEDEKLSINSDSIVFLGIEPIFYIPQYIALRFNLRVKNAYKGLLLGTGPIVDPGYIGKLFIPLHNLTSNEYCIKREADLIDIEFTKISKNDKWDIKSKNEQMNIVNSLNFASVPYIPKTFDRPTLDMDSYDSYIDKSLTADPLFAKKGTEMPLVNSSIGEKTEEFNNMQKTTNKKIKEMNYLRNILAITIVAVVFAAVTLSISTYRYFSETTKLSEAIQSINKQREEYEKDKADFDELITELQNRVDDLENASNSSGDTP